MTGTTPVPAALQRHAHAVVRFGALDVAWRAGAAGGITPAGLEDLVAIGRLVEAVAGPHPRVITPADAETLRELAEAAITTAGDRVPDDPAHDTEATLVLRGLRESADAVLAWAETTIGGNMSERTTSSDPAGGAS